MWLGQPITRPINEDRASSVGLNSWGDRYVSGEFHAQRHRRPGREVLLPNQRSIARRKTLLSPQQLGQRVTVTEAEPVSGVRRYRSQ